MSENCFYIDLRNSRGMQENFYILCVAGQLLFVSFFDFQATNCELRKRLALKLFIGLARGWPSSEEFIGVY